MRGKRRDRKEEMNTNETTSSKSLLLSYGKLSLGQTILSNDKTKENQKTKPPEKDP